MDKDTDSNLIVPPTELNTELLNSMKMESFALWSMYSNIKIDNKRITFHDHKYLIPIYQSLAREIAVMKAAQLGLTVWLILRLLWHCKKDDVNTGLYFPTKEGVEGISKTRITPLLQENPELVGYSNKDDTMRIKKIGNSYLHLSYLGGSVTKDSTPLDILAFDEVRLVDEMDVDQTLERVSHSTHKNKYFASTAGYPEMDIHRRFLNSNQMWFHTDCRCSDGIRLADTWPDCVAERNDGRLYLECPKCKTIIKDPAEGRFIADNPKSEVDGFHIHQMLSKYISLEEIWRSYNETTNVKEFYNSKLGLPWIDKENIPITQEILHKCVDTSAKWDDIGEGMAMGVDQMKGLNVVVIAKRVGKKKQIVHLEWIEDTSPFDRLYVLMEKYNIKSCCIDATPNANEAYQFAKTFQPKAYLVTYVDSREMVQWMDRKTNKKMKQQQRHYSDDTKFQYKCLLDRYQSLDFTFKQFEYGKVIIPDPREKVASIRNKQTGKPEPRLICEDIYFKHMKSVCREQVEQNKNIGKFKMQWKHLGIDPHFAHATNYAFFALERMKSNFSFILV